MEGGGWRKEGSNLVLVAMMQWNDLPYFTHVWHSVTTPSYYTCTGNQNIIYVYFSLLSSNFKCILIKGHELCTQGSIRLQGGTNTSGRVDICHNNIWGTVCGNSNWRLVNAQVACRQLGFPSTGATTFTVSTIGTRVSWLSSVRCDGIESNLFNCDVQLSEINCYRSQYVGVSCQDSKS